jgi:hypothetical protein
MSRDQSTEGTDRDPERNPFACSWCGCFLSETERLGGREYCTDCHREPNRPRDGESRDGAGHIRPVPPHVPPTPEVDDVE